MIPRCVIFDVGRVLFEWDLRHLFAKLIADGDELEWFVANVVTPSLAFPARRRASRSPRWSPNGRPNFPAMPR